MDEQLIAAIESRDTQRVKKLLATGANPNVKKGDKTAYELARYGPDEIKCALIEAGADDSSLRHSLVWAVMTGRVEIVRVLLTKSADVNVSTYSGSPLQEAARVGNAEIVDLLIAAGADVDNGSMLSNPLLKAIERGNFDIALKLIAAGANPSKTTKFGGIPPIAMAAAQGSAAVIRALIAAGADVNILTSGITINHATIQRQAGSALKTAFNTLETLGKAFESLDAVETGDAPLSEVGETIESIDIATNRAKLATSNIAEPEIAVDTFPAILAARCGHGEALAVLLAAGADPYRKDGEGLSAYDWAVRNEHSDVLEVLRQFGVDASRVSPEEHLLNAAEQGDVAAVRTWLSEGANVNARDQRRKTKNRTPLMLAASTGHLEVVNLLLDAGADINATDIVDVNQRQPRGIISDDYESFPAMRFSLGITALMLAAIKGYKNIVQVLVSHQANLQARDCFARDALCLGCINGHLEVVQILMQAAVNINQQDSEGDTPLLMALRNTHIELAKFLIESGADVNAKNNEDHTPLIEAVQKEEHLELIQMLIERGADVNAVSKDGDTAMTLADLFDHHHVIEMLVEYGVEKRRWDEQDEDDEENNSDDDKRWGVELPRPDFSQTAQNPEYQKAVADLGEICGTQPVPMYDEISGLFKVHVNSKRRSKIKTEDLQQQFLQRGCFVYEPKKAYDAEGPKQLCVLPTTNKYDVIALHQTNGCNYGIGPGYVVEWLRELEAVQPFILTLVAHDTLEGRFLTPIEDPKGLADRMYDFCSDIVDQGCGSVERLAESLCSSDNLFFWWD
ncbi:ankyrin repeat domain-containing protein [Nostoc sp.]|uniref:ankyrin repeat domain-containing protein n=1 Tax=Nostoc sp. TaxID=1180 RepID=UPI002FF78D1A